MINTEQPRLRALADANRLRPGDWESVEALALLAIEFRNEPAGRQLLDTARTTAQRLKSGTWQTTRALAVLARAEREVI